MFSSALNAQPHPRWLRIGARSTVVEHLTSTRAPLTGVPFSRRWAVGARGCASTEPSQYFISFHEVPVRDPGSRGRQKK